jgi:hypothetical protein
MQEILNILRSPLVTNCIFAFDHLY